MSVAANTWIDDTITIEKVSSVLLFLTHPAGNEDHETEPMQSSLQNKKIQSPYLSLGGMETINMIISFRKQENEIFQLLVEKEYYI